MLRYGISKSDIGEGKPLAYTYVDFGDGYVEFAITPRFPDDVTVMLYLDKFCRDARVLHLCYDTPKPVPDYTRIDGFWMTGSVSDDLP